MAGKTRLVVQVLREEWPDARVLFPKSEDDVEKLLKNWRRPVRGAIIFLDELERFLGKEEFTLGVLNTWIDDSCTVVATATRMNYTRWRAELDSKFPGWEIVNRFHPLPLEAKLSDDELGAVGSTSYAGDLASIEQLGLGRVLGRAEDIRRRFTSALDSHKGRAGLVKAAADWSRVGLGSASKEALLTLAKAYDDDFWEEPDWEAEWAWVIGKTTDAPLVLRTGKDSWEALDLLAEEADWPLTETTLRTMATCPHTARQAVTLVFEMHSRNLLTEDRATESLVQEAEYLLQKISSANPSDANLLGIYASFLTAIHQKYNRAEEIYEKAIKADPNNAIILRNYSQFLFLTGRDEKGAKFAERTPRLAEQGEETPCAECHFYLFMHSPRHRITSGRALKALLADGVTTGDWSFEGNLERLTQEEDPRYELARAVAEALRNGNASALNDFEEWRDLDLPDREE